MTVNSSKQKVLGSMMSNVDHVTSTVSKMEQAGKEVKRGFQGLRRQLSTESTGEEDSSIFSRFRLNRDRRAISADRPVIASHSNVSSTTPRAKSKSSRIEKLRELTDRFRPQYDLPPSVPPRSQKKEERFRKLSAGSEPLKSPSPSVLPPRPVSGVTEKKTRKPSVLFRTKSGEGRSSPSTAREFFRRVSPMRLASPNLARVVSLKDGDAHKLNSSGSSRSPSLKKTSRSPSVAKTSKPEINLKEESPPSSSEIESVDDMEKSPAKLNPKMMVGSYQQRTIPFRSVSFSQYDNRDAKYGRLPKSSRVDPLLTILPEEQKGPDGPHKNEVSTINKLVAFFTDKMSPTPQEASGQSSELATVIPDALVHELMEKKGDNYENSIISKLLRESPMIGLMTKLGDEPSAEVVQEEPDVYSIAMRNIRGRKVEKQSNIQNNSDSSLSDEGCVADGSSTTISEDIMKPHRKIAHTYNLSDPAFSEFTPSSEDRCLTFPPRKTSSDETSAGGIRGIGGEAVVTPQSSLSVVDSQFTQSESFSDDGQVCAREQRLKELGSSQETDDMTNDCTERTVLQSSGKSESGGIFFQIPEITERAPSETRIQKRRPMRGPYGAILEARMSESENELKPRVRIAKSSSPRANSPLVNEAWPSVPGTGRSGSVPSTEHLQIRTPPPCHLPLPSSPSHQRTCSSPSRLIGQPSSLSDSGTLPKRPGHFEEQKSATLGRTPSARRHMDTRTHVVGELYDTERSYIESLNILVTKYINYLKNFDGSSVIDAATVDEIFYQIPAILGYHETFLSELRRRLETWDATTSVGDVITNNLTQPPVFATYIAFVSHWQVAKETVRIACQMKPAFAKFLMKMKCEHKGKLELDSLLIMPVQRIPRYELLIKLLLKHTPRDHPDHDQLVRAQREVHELALKINSMEKDYMQFEHQQAMLRELESLVDGLEPGHLASPQRNLIRHDSVTIPSSTLGIRKERTLFLCSDLLVIASVKKKVAMKRSAGFSSPAGSISGLLEANKLKLLMRVHLDDVRIKAREDSLRRSGVRDQDHYEDDLATLSKITELTSSLHVGHSALDDIIKDMSSNISRQLIEKQASDSNLSILELTVHAQDSAELFQVAFSNPEHRTSWEEAFHQTKSKLAQGVGKRSQPDFVTAVPIRKTRSGLQLGCATSTFQSSSKEVWICNSDGHVGQICLLSLDPEPAVASCNSVCSSKITCILSVPGVCLSLSKDSDESESVRQSSPEPGESCIALDSDSSSDEDDCDESVDDESVSSRRDTSSTFDVSSSRVGSLTRDDCPSMSEALLTTPTIWLGTEDGCLHIYSALEGIKNKRTKKKIQLLSSVTDLLYGSDRVFVTLNSGDLFVYFRDSSGVWQLNDPKIYPIGTPTTPPTRLALVGANIWVAVGSNIIILAANTMMMEDRIAVPGDGPRQVSSFSVSGAGVWTAVSATPIVRLYHPTNFTSLLEISVAPFVNKILLGCDEIIRQHKSACLRVTALYSCKDTLWVGTTAGVILNVQLDETNSNPQVNGLLEGHTGHVRFLTALEVPLDFRLTRYRRQSARECPSPTTPSGVRYVVISGGDGVEDFSGIHQNDVTGKDDSTNHVLLWRV